MKYNFRISTLSIVCAISAGVSVPVFGAPAVRSLGGAGTYAGTAGAVGGVLSAAPSAGRAGSLSSGRVGSATATNSANATNSTMSGVSSNRVASTRAVASPRLSIGKYLSGATVGGTTGGSTVKPGQSGVDTDGLKDRIDELEVKVEDLANDIADLTGQTTTVEYADGILTIIQGDKTTEYDLSEYLATKEELQTLEDKLNDLVIPTKVSELENDAGYITQADIPSTDGFATREELTKQLQALRDLISGLDYVESGDLTKINNLIDLLQQGQMLNQSQIQDLQKTLNELDETYVTHTELNQAIDKVNAGLADLENYYTKTESDARFQQVLNDEANVIQQGAGVVKSVSAVDGIVTVERDLITDADVADDAKISADKIEGLVEFEESVDDMAQGIDQELENVTQDLDEVRKKFTDLQLDNVLHGIMADGTYVINFSQDGTVSYSPVVFIGADGKSIDMSKEAVWPDDGKPK